MELINIGSDVWVPTNSIESITKEERLVLVGDNKSIAHEFTGKEPTQMAYIINVKLKNSTQVQNCEYKFGNKEKRDIVFMTLIKMISENKPIIDVYGLSRQYDQSKMGNQSRLGV